MNIKQKINAICFILLSIMVSGCASVTKVHSLKGMMPQEVVSEWGEPRSIKSVKNTCCTPKNEIAWYYYNTKVQPSKPDRAVIFIDGVVQYAYIYK